MVLSGQAQKEEASFLGKGGWSNVLCKKWQDPRGRRIGRLLLTTLLSSPGQKPASRKGREVSTILGRKATIPSQRESLSHRGVEL